MQPFYMVSLADTLTFSSSLKTRLAKNLRDEYPLEGMVGWVAIAQLADLATNGMSLSGSAGCRLLLQNMLILLNIEGTLNDSHFPYHITLLKPSMKKTAYCVSFSHSRTSVAVLLSNQPMLGIDIEKRPISSAIAQRYFSPIELAWLNTLTLARQPLARTLLWTLKESRIKSQTGSQLFSGIGHDILTDIGISEIQFLLNDNINLPSRSQLCAYDDNLNKASKTVAHTLIGFDTVYQCGWWINFS